MSGFELKEAPRAMADIQPKFMNMSVDFLSPTASSPRAVNVLSDHCSSEAIVQFTAAREQKEGADILIGQTKSDNTE